MPALSTRLRCAVRFSIAPTMGIEPKESITCTSETPVAPYTDRLLETADLFAHVRFGPEPTFSPALPLVRSAP
jgi:hypothetical protein